MALDAVMSSSTFNAYCDVAFADAYHGGRLHNDAYRCASTADKEAGLIWATRLFNSIMWAGSRVAETQPQAWPRQWVEFEGYYLSPLSIPVRIKNATAELAMWLLAGDTTAPAGTEGFSRIKVDTIELVVSSSDRQKWMNDAVYDVIYPFMVDGSRGISVHKVVT